MYYLYNFSGNLKLLKLTKHNVREVIFPYFRGCNRASESFSNVPKVRGSNTKWWIVGFDLYLWSKWLLHHLASSLQCPWSIAVPSTLLLEFLFLLTHRASSIFFFSLSFLFLFLSFFFFFFLVFLSFRAAPTAYRGSQARGPAGAAAASHSHRHKQHGIWATFASYTTAHSHAWSLIHWARPGIKPVSLWMLVGFANYWAMMGTPRDSSISCTPDSCATEEHQKILKSICPCSGCLKNGL